MLEMIHTAYSTLGALPLVQVAALMVVYRLLPPAPGETDVWARQEGSRPVR